MNSLIAGKMNRNEPCAACTWTTERQDSCCYNSHLKLFYGVSDRGVWSLGSRYIVKDRGVTPPNFEAKSIQFLQTTTTIPVPAILAEWNEDSDGASLTIMDRIDGVTLDEAWCDLPQADRERVAEQMVDLLDQLRGLQSNRLQSLGEQPLYSAFLFRNGFGFPHGPFQSDEEVWGDMVQALSKVPDKACHYLRQRMPPCAPYTFTHGDLSTSNIIVKDGNVVGIVDWEASGFFPVWWEFVATSIHQGDKDREWKTLLQKRMAQEHTNAQEFWLDYFSLSYYPDVDERGRRLLNKLEAGVNIG